MQSEVDELRTFVIQALLVVASIGLFVMLLAYLLTTRLQRIISIPLARLAETASRISEAGDYTVRADKLADDEIGEMTTAFNLMLGQIESRDQEIRQREALLRATFESTADGLLVVDEQQRVVSYDFSGNREPLPYFGDARELPQVRLHVDARFWQLWRAWLRYTQQGSHCRGNEATSDFDGHLIDHALVADRQVTLTLNYDRKFGDGPTLAAMVSADSFDTQRNKDGVFHPNPDHALNSQVDFAETELFVRALGDWDIVEWAALALGAEFAVDFFGPGWGDSPDTMRLGGAGRIVNGPESNAVGDPSNSGTANRNGEQPIFVGKGWRTVTYSVCTATVHNIGLGGAGIDVSRRLGTCDLGASMRRADDHRSPSSSTPVRFAVPTSRSRLPSRPVAGGVEIGRPRQRDVTRCVTPSRDGSGGA